MAFLHRPKKNGTTRRWAIEWTDRTKGAGKAGRRRADCASGDHEAALDAADLGPEERAALACGATSATLRKALLAAYESLERRRRQDAARLAGRVARHGKPLEELVDEYLEVLAHRVRLKRGEPSRLSPEAASLWRPTYRERPIAESSAANVRATLGRFRDWLSPGTRTGDLDGALLTRFLDHVRHARDGRALSAATFNGHRQILYGFLATLTSDAAAQLFRVDVGALFKDHVEALPEPRKEIIVYPARDLAAFLDAAEGPVLDAALLLLCSGVRRAEGLRLEWRDVDLDHGILTVRSTKTSTVRYVPLAGDPTGDVAPMFLELLRAWRERDPARRRVLAGVDGAAEWPRRLEKDWTRTATGAGVAVQPQGCRRTFESALAAIGFPSTLSSFWLGHTAEVAASNYLAYSAGRLPGRTVEAVLGLEPFLERAIERARAGRAFRVLEREATAPGTLEQRSTR